MDAPFCSACAVKASSIRGLEKYRRFAEFAVGIADVLQGQAAVTRIGGKQPPLRFRGATPGGMPGLTFSATGPTPAPD